MSINPVDIPTSFDAAPQKPASSAAAGGAEFSEALAKALPQGEGKLSPVAAAELLRLQMLGRAVAIGGDGEASASVNGVQGALSKFLANLARGQEGVAVDGGAGSVAADALGADGPEGGGADRTTEGIIDKAAARYGVDRGLIRAVIKAESDFNPRAVSSAGAQGLMQLMPGTARTLGVRDAFDPEQNVMAGTRFLKDLLQRYGGDVDSALAAYNWGPGNFEKKAHLPRETREYLVKVKGFYDQYTA